ncbi:hypothetical protein F511_05080 [Dorcoceras hygrometricum]|uniref:NAC domain-containing protein n=1 Tax=Dorcoceras hygrometricum TaxID=472368 RepID=A0A2Z7AN78_9LAMI|nr:hypothetical protein F511_05080 [Dorcoceras hygrometricum]
MEDYRAFHESHESHLPPGFRFHPLDEELITYYLLKKVLDCNFTSRAIAEVDLNKWRAKMGEKEWYFFSLRDRKYPTGLRTNRATEAGYWKATGKDREIYSSKTCSLVGMKKTLVFYLGRAPKGEKSNWVMHEYRLEGKLAYHYLSRNSKDEWVISRVFQKSGSGGAAGGGGKKRPSVHVNPEVSSPSSVSLPPLLELSANSTDHDSSYNVADGKSKEHVPCFSTAAPSGFNHHSLFEFPPPPPLSSLMNDLSSSSSAPHFPSHSLGASAFPSLRALKENLQLPHFFSGFSAQSMVGCGDPLPGYGPLGQFPPPEDQKIGPTELDCMWSF